MTPDFLAKTSIEAAPLLLGWYLCRQLPEGLVKLKIVEVEAYHQDDPASHSFKGMTARTAPMFKSGGHIYVYFTYGMHYCLNLVAGKEGRGEGVLLRAAEPIEGTKIMMENRGTGDLRNIANGPGKLAQAIGISSTELSGKKLGKKTLWLESPAKPPSLKDIMVGPRIGIRQGVDEPWRFSLRNNIYVSRG